MEYEFSARSRYVPPMFFGDGTEVSAGDVVEAWLDNVHVRVRIAALDGDAITGTVEGLQDDCRTLTEHGGLSVGGAVALRLEHVRCCWTSARASAPAAGEAEPSDRTTAEPVAAKADPIAAPRAEQVAETTAEPIPAVQHAVAPTVQATAEAQAEPTVEPAAEAPTVQATAEAQAEPTVEPAAEAQAEPTVEPAAEAQAEPVTEPKAHQPTAEPEQLAEPTAEPAPEPTTEAEQVAGGESQPGVAA